MVRERREKRRQEVSGVGGQVSVLAGRCRTAGGRKGGGGRQEVSGVGWQLSDGGREEGGGSTRSERCWQAGVGRRAGGRGGVDKK